MSKLRHFFLFSRYLPTGSFGSTFDCSVPSLQHHCQFSFCSPLFTLSILTTLFSFSSLSFPLSIVSLCFFFSFIRILAGLFWFPFLLTTTYPSFSGLLFLSDDIEELFVLSFICDSILKPLGFYFVLVLSFSMTSWSGIVRYLFWILQSVVCGVLSVLDYTLQPSFYEYIMPKNLVRKLFFSVHYSFRSWMNVRDTSWSLMIWLWMSCPSKISSDWAGNEKMI